jgi:putative ABC transport system permease protein
MAMPIAVRLSLRSVRRAPVKAFLTGAGLFLGVLAITLTVASGEGTRRVVIRQWRAMVGNMDALFISPGGPAQRGMATIENSITTLTPEDAAAIAAGVPGVKQVATEQHAFGVGAQVGDRNGTLALFGVSPNWVDIRGDHPQRGAMFSDEQNQAVERVALIGNDVAREFFPDVDPVGRAITVAGVSFQVQGVLQQNGAGPGGISLDNLVLVPILTSSRRVFNHTHLNQVRVQLTDPDRSESAIQAVTALLRGRHQLAPGQLDDFRVSSPRAMIAQRRTADTALQRTILWVGILALILGGVMVANLMYAAAAQRTPEIGMRRAAGATRGDILRELWTEAILISTSAGVAAVMTSLLAIAAGARLLRLALAVSWPVTALALGATAAAGLIAGYWPARRAAALEPAEILRRQE